MSYPKTDFQLLGILISLDLPLSVDAINRLAGYDCSKQLWVLAQGTRPWVYYRKDWHAWMPTMRGRRAYCEACTIDREPIPGVSAWIDEALTGMDRRGRQSKITRAALPTTR